MLRQVPVSDAHWSIKPVDRVNRKPESETTVNRDGESDPISISDLQADSHTHTYTQIYTHACIHTHTHALPHSLLIFTRVLLNETTKYVKYGP